MSTQALANGWINLSDILDMKVYAHCLPYFGRQAAQTMPSHDERRVLNGLRNLDPQIIGDIYDKYFSEIYRYVCYRINDETVAEDIASDVFVHRLKLYKTAKVRNPALKAG